ncbi:PaaI family thioesterase [Streptomyces klenkii]|uniref:Acyl-coenzyme A thioesterase THEM4 n=1 Tax=Streptomyces klenkii TaxID=1420899 RepID=A0A3B0A919_9ACTN|nr:PaaI family thioesterase [Streptomyces klenkii]RKN57133.1 PaaI family thioesterase [Streptomyces klenkii]
MQALLAMWSEKFVGYPDGSDLPAHHDHCLGCGPENPHGHRLRAVRHGDGVQAWHTFDNRHVGAPGIAHGGAVATVVDDLYGFLLFLEGGPAVTRQLAVDYLAPVLIGTTYRLDAQVARREGRKLFVTAGATAPDGRPVITSTAVFVKVSVEHFAQGISPDVPGD